MKTTFIFGNGLEYTTELIHHLVALQTAKTLALEFNTYFYYKLN